MKAFSKTLSLHMHSLLIVSFVLVYLFELARGPMSVDPNENDPTIHWETYLLMEIVYQWWQLPTQTRNQMLPTRLCLCMTPKQPPTMVAKDVWETSLLHLYLQCPMIFSFVTRREKYSTAPGRQKSGSVRTPKWSTITCYVRALASTMMTWRREGSSFRDK